MMIASGWVHWWPMEGRGHRNALAWKKVETVGMGGSTMSLVNPQTTPRVVTRGLGVSPPHRPLLAALPHQQGEGAAGAGAALFASSPKDRRYI